MDFIQFTAGFSPDEPVVRIMRSFVREIQPE